MGHVRSLRYLIASAVLGFWGVGLLFYAGSSPFELFYAHFGGDAMLLPSLYTGVCCLTAAGLLCVASSHPSPHYARMILLSLLVFTLVWECHRGSVMRTIAVSYFARFHEVLFLLLFGWEALDLRSWTGVYSGNLDRERKST